MSILFSALISFKIPKTWQGEFQIVLQKNNEKKTDSILENVSNNTLKFLTRSNTEDIKTQITILKSPSVLMPIFEFVKSDKIKKGINVNNWIFKKWSKDYLEVELEKGTKVLNLTFKDKDQDIILPTLELISKTYQSYNGNQRKENLRKSINYLENQINDYQQKNKISQRELVKFSLKNDLELPEIFNNNLNSNSELKRSLTINEIKLIEQQLISLKKIKGIKQTLKFISMISSNLDDIGIKQYISKIEILNQELNTRSTFYKEKYILKDKNLLEKNVELLKEEIIKSLLARKELLEDNLESLKRPLENIIKQRELLLNAKLELKTIEKLQNDARAINLEEKRILPAWELITNPTLLQTPASPNKKRVTMIGGIFGFLLISILCYLKEFNSNYIFEEDQFAKKINGKLLLNQSISNEKITKIFFENLNKEIKTNKNKYGFLMVGFIEKKSLEILNSYIEKYLSTKLIVTEESLENIYKFDELILVTTIGKVTSTQLEDLIKIIQITNTKISGFINI